jgi:DNA-directed RNA polymerase subunit M/transcription elongation factor TFIIS
MHAADAAGDYLSLLERYRQMKDGELLRLWRQSAELTDLARQALELEVKHRDLQPESDDTPPPILEPIEASSADPSDEPDPYEDDRELVELRTVWSVQDALQVEALLDRAGIPFFMGPEKAKGVAEVTSNFANGVSVKIMRIGMPWAGQAMSNYFPEDEPPDVPEEDLEEAPMRCPKCRSEEVIFDGLATEQPDNGEFPPASAEPESLSSAPVDSPQRFDWTCDSCGYQWTDDGVARNP